MQGQTNSKVSSMFAGTQEKCVACKKTVYPIEKVCISDFIKEIHFEPCRPN